MDGLCRLRSTGARQAAPSTELCRIEPAVTETNDTTPGDFRGMF